MIKNQQPSHLKSSSYFPPKPLYKNSTLKLYEKDGKYDGICQSIMKYDLKDIYDKMRKEENEKKISFSFNTNQINSFLKKSSTIMFSANHQNQNQMKIHQISSSKSGNQDQESDDWMLFEDMIHKSGL